MKGFYVGGGEPCEVSGVILNDTRPDTVMRERVKPEHAVAGLV